MQKYLKNKILKYKYKNKIKTVILKYFDFWNKKEIY